ncbi:hypothetical protein [Streptomyces sp. NPDC014733]|uniref:hypothetical protein n=1 Tax=Streptomyces sp. NPDC014733 TaxID=3364885 RepID=UPI0036F5CD68
MDDCTKVSLAAAVAAGYVLGRTKKGRLAIGLASLIAGRELPLNPREAIRLGLRKLAQNPQLAPLVEQARSEVLEAGRTALSATANRRLEAVADALEQRTNTLLGPLEAEDEEAADEEEEATADEGAEDGGREEETEPQEEEEPRRRPKKRPAAAAKKSSAGKTPAKKTTAGKSTPEKAAAKKRPSRDTRRR